MSVLPDIVLQFPPDCDQKNYFRVWSDRRQELVRTLGHRLLMLSETELAQCYEKWEQIIKDLEKSDKLILLLQALLHISVLHHFNRSSDQIKSHIPFMRKLLENKNRTLIMCSGKTFYWLAYESQECIDFLRENITRASIWIQNSQTVFSALYVLKQSGKFILPNVFEETTHNFKIIWNSVISDDVDLQTIAAKVVKYHFRGLKPNNSSPHNIFNDCIKQIKSNSLSLYGVIRVIGYILKIYKQASEAMTVIDLVERFPIQKQEPLTFSWFSMLLKIVQNKSLAYVITPDSAPKILTSIFTASRKFLSVRLYHLVQEFIKSFTPSTIRAFAPNIIDFLQESVSDRRQQTIAAISFDILIELINLFDNLKIQPSFFLNSEPSTHYVTALRHTMRVFGDVKPIMLQKFNEGLLPKATINQQILSLTIFCKFAKHLFDNTQIIFEKLQNFVKSKNEEIRLLMANILPVFSNKKASDDLLFLALFDSSKRVRAAAVSQLIHLEHLDQSKMLPQILTDPSYQVRRNAIKLISSVAPLNPMLFYIPITSFVQQTITSILTISNPSACQKLSSLLPLIAEYLIKFCPAYIPQLIKVCYTFLNHPQNEKYSKINEHLLKQQLNDDVDLQSEQQENNENNQNNNQEKPQENINLSSNNFNASQINFKLNQNTQASTSTSSSNNQPTNKIVSIIQRDMNHDNNQALLSNARPFDKSWTNLNHLFDIENKVFLDKRDANLFETLRCLAEHLEPYLDEIIPVYVSVFSELRSETVYLSALASLIELTNKLPQASLIPSKQPYFPRVLIRLLRHRPSEKVAILIIKLMATFGITAYPKSLGLAFDAQDEEQEYDFKSPSYYTDSVMTALIKLLDQNHSCVFECITSIFVKESNDAVKFLGPIINAYSNAIMTTKPTIRSVLFHQLEVISYYCGIRMEPYCNILGNLILQNITMPAALKLACVLSYHLKTEFIPYVSPLYQEGIRLLGSYFNSPVILHPMSIQSSSLVSTTPPPMHVGSLPSNPISPLPGLSQEDIITEELITFLTYAIIFQNQPLDVFIAGCEHRLASNPSIDEINNFLFAMTTIAQLSDVTFESSRIARICIPLLKSNSRSYVMQLLYSLVVYCHLSFEFIEWLVPEEDIGFPALKDYLNGKTITTDGFLTPISIHLDVDIPDYVPLGHKPVMSVFDSFQAPPGNTEKWLEDLCSEVIHSSPHIAIRACHQTALTSPEFRVEIFPVAFLSCWRHTTESHRIKFSNTMNQIFSDTTQPPDQIFLTLAELLFRAGCPFKISGYVLAKACTSPMQGLRFLVKYYQENPRDTKAIEMLMQLNTQLGRVSSAKGILKNVDLPSLGKWSETLGEWEQALEIYEKDPEKNLPAILRCYAKLERWADIRKLSDKFQIMPIEEKNQTSLWYSWASLKNHDFNDISSFMVYLPETNDYDIMLFRILYYIQSEQYDKAKQAIAQDMEYLVSDCSIYTSLNANQADTNLIYANHFTELEEVLNAKINRSDEVPPIWNRRLNYITGNGYSWMRLCEIRSLLVTPKSSKKTYVKLLSVLMKERKWALVDSFLPVVVENIDNFDVQITFVKILWERGKLSEAIESIKLLNIIHNVQNFEEFQEQFTKISPNIINDVCKIIKEDNPTPENLFKYAQKTRESNVFTPHQRAKMLRLEAQWRSDLSIDNVDLTLKLFEESTKLESNEYKTWANWAYASTKAVDINNEFHDKYVQMAINGFLKASILHTSNTLEYLCQLFSLFFRYASTASIPQDLYTRISELKPPIIERILPQVICHISHQDENVKNVVHALIVNFSVVHFQAIVFQLQLIADGGEGEKSVIAKDLLDKISLPHQELAKEAKMFADGLIRSAVTFYDIWYSKIDEAYHLELAGEHERSMEKLRSLTQMRRQISCKLDQTQLKAVDSSYNSFVTAINKKPKSEQEINMMWNTVRLFFQTVRDKIKKLDVIQLETISEQLAEKRNFLLSVPGTYSTNSPGPSIVSIDSTLPVLGTQQHPRLLYMQGSDGQRWKFLLKGNEDLRLDQRIMQFFDLINSLVKKAKPTRRLITIINYPITPLAPIAGLISWVNGADTLHQLVTDNRKSLNIPATLENEILNMYVGQCAPSLLGVQKLEMWSKVAPQCPATDLRDLFWMKSQNSVQWVNCVDTFCISSALMSIAGYVIGLGDRHPSNIMIQRKLGHVVHIDFGDSFEVTMKRIKMPEKVPFRLTRMITNALGVAGTEGMFKTICESTLYILRKNKSSILAQLEIFVHEPIFASRDEQGDGNSIMQRVSMKLNGLDPSLDPGEEVTKELSVEQQASRLISIASDHTKYVMHYDGWCPYW